MCPPPRLLWLLGGVLEELPAWATQPTTKEMPQRTSKCYKGRCVGQIECLPRGLNEPTVKVSQVAARQKIFFHAKLKLQTCGLDPVIRTGLCSSCTTDHNCCLSTAQTGGNPLIKQGGPRPHLKSTWSKRGGKVKQHSN